MTKRRRFGSIADVDENALNYTRSTIWWKGKEPFHQINNGCSRVTITLWNKGELAHSVHLEVYELALAEIQVAR